MFDLYIRAETWLMCTKRDFVVLCDRQPDQCKFERLAAAVCNFALSHDVLIFILIEYPN